MTRKNVVIGVSFVSLLEVIVIFLTMNLNWPLWIALTGTAIYVGLIVLALLQLIKTKPVEINKMVGLAIVALSSVVLFVFGIYSLISSHATSIDIIVALLLVLAGLCGFAFILFENKDKNGVNRDK